MAYREVFDPELDRRIDLLHYRREMIINQMVDELESADLEQEFEALYKIWITPTEKLMRDLNHVGLTREESCVKVLIEWLKDVDEELAQKLIMYKELSHELNEAESHYTKVLQELIAQLRVSRHEQGIQNRALDSLRRRKCC